MKKYKPDQIESKFQVVLTFCILFPVFLETVMQDTNAGRNYLVYNFLIGLFLVNYILYSIFTGFEKWVYTWIYWLLMVQLGLFAFLIMHLSVTPMDEPISGILSFFALHGSMLGILFLPVVIFLVLIVGFFQNQFKTLKKK